MRELLAEIGTDERHWFTATYDQSSTFTSAGHPVRRSLLLNVKDEQGRVVADHVWIGGVRFQKIPRGTMVEFQARACRYVKGYEDKAVDFKLNYPTKILPRGMDPDWKPSQLRIASQWGEFIRWQALDE